MASRSGTTLLVALAAVLLLVAVALAVGIVPSPFSPEGVSEPPQPLTTPGGSATTPGGSATMSDESTTFGGSATTPGGSLATPDGPLTTSNGSSTTAPISTSTGTTTRASTAGTQTVTIRRTTGESVETTSATTETTVASPTTPDRRYDRTTVTFQAPDGTEKASVRTWIADDRDKRYTGLSNTETLRNGTGMLFVYPEEGSRTFVMRRMDYPLDMVFVGADRRISAIKSAPAPDPGQDGDSIRRSGSARWILEVPRGWTTENDINSGDVMVIGENSSGG